MTDLVGPVPGSRRLRPAISPPRPFHGLNAAVWTGRELLVVTIARPPAPPQDEPTGAAYDLATNRWRRLAPTPTKLNTQRHPVGAIVWAGTRLLVWPELTNGATAAGARLWAYEPASDRWSVLPPPSDRTRAVLSPLQLVWTGRGLVEAGVGFFDPDHDRVTAIAPLPEPAAGIAWTGAALAAILPGKPLTGRSAQPPGTRPPTGGCGCPAHPSARPGYPSAGPSGLASGCCAGARSTSAVRSACSYRPAELARWLAGERNPVPHPLPLRNTLVTGTRLFHKPPRTGFEAVEPAAGRFRVSTILSGEGRSHSVALVGSMVVRARMVTTPLLCPRANR